MGLDFGFMMEYLPWYVDAARLTVKIAFWGILIALATGVVCSMVLYYKIPVLCQAVSVYIEISRNTPLLVQLFFLYFGLPKLGIIWSAEICAIAGLGFLGGSYMAESLRSGLGSVEKIQIEAAAGLGMNPCLIMREVIFPQALVMLVLFYLILLLPVSIAAGIMERRLKYAGFGD